MAMRERLSRRSTDEAPVTFYDFAACFSKAEWKLLQDWQMELYEILMKEIHQSLTSLGPLIASSVFSLRPKEMEDLFPVDRLESDISSWSSPNLKKKEEFESGLMEHHVAEEKESSTVPLQVTSPDASFSIGDEDDNYSTDLNKSERFEGICSLTERAVNTSVVSFEIKEEQEPYFVNFKDSERGERVSSPGEDDDISQVESFIIKEDGTTRSLDHQNSDTKKSITFPTDGLKRKRKHKYSVKCTKKTPPLKVTLGRDKSNVSLSFESETYSTGPLRSGSNEGLGEEISAMYDNDTQSNEHQVATNKVIPAPYNEWENYIGKTDLLCPQNESQLMSSECENVFIHRVDFTRNQRAAPSGLGGINSKQKRNSHSIESDKTFDQKKNQILNEKALTAEHRYTCAKCHKHFSQMRSLIRHQTIHSKERPYQCIECEKSFNRQDNLVRHNKSHIRDFQAQLDLWTTATPYELQN